MSKERWMRLDEAFGRIETGLKDMEAGQKEVARRATSMCEKARELERQLARLRETLRGLDAHLAEVQRDKAA